MTCAAPPPYRSLPAVLEAVGVVVVVVIVDNNYYYYYCNYYYCCYSPTPTLRNSCHRN